MGTFDSGAFQDKEREDGKRNIYFNGPGDGSQHGHVVQNPDGTYEYARDVEGNVYIENKQTLVLTRPRTFGRVSSRRDL